MAIQRSSLREQIRDELIERIRDGRVQPGESINEVQLASDLGVSRTPLREALIALEQTGQLESESGKGFRFRPVSAKELTELAPILAALEGFALDMSDPAKLPGIAQELLSRARAFGDDAVSLRALTDNDDLWHEHLLSACSNKRLLEMLAVERQTFHRYESLMVHDDWLVNRVADEHIAIAQALAEGDLEQAKQALNENWVNGAERIAESAGVQ